MAKGEKVVGLFDARGEVEGKKGFPDAKGVIHYQIQFVCVRDSEGCGLFFLVLTWHPENWKDCPAYCPECGKRGALVGQVTESKQGIYEVFGGSLSEELGE